MTEKVYNLEEVLSKYPEQFETVKKLSVASLIYVNEPHVIQCARRNLHIVADFVRKGYVKDGKVFIEVEGKTQKRITYYVCDLQPCLNCGPIANASFDFDIS